jgi:hypothetical protein
VGFEVLDVSFCVFLFEWGELVDVLGRLYVGSDVLEVAVFGDVFVVFVGTSGVSFCVFLFVWGELKEYRLCVKL